MTDDFRNQDRHLILLGTGTSVGIPMIGCRCPVCRSENPKNHRTRTGVAVHTPQGWFLIDTPPELRLQLLREDIRMVHAVLYTHSHADHVFGLDDLRVIGLYTREPLPLYCEPIVEDQLRRAYSYAFTPPDPQAHPGAVPQFTIRRIGTEPFELLGLQIQPIRLLHGRLEILGYRIGNTAFCTDVSAIPDESWPLLENLDVLVIDALREKPHPTHFGISQSLEVIRRVQPRRAVLTHISHNLDHEATNARLPAGVEVGYDGLSLPY